MARIKYGCYLLEDLHCYVITNADLDYAEDVTDESFTNPPIKMTVEKIDRDWESAFDAEENPMNHSKLQDNLMAVLRGELPEFRLTGVNVNESGIYLVYYSTLPPEKFNDGTEGYSGGQILVCGNYTILFEVEYLDGSPAKQYRVESKKIGICRHQTQITEYLGGHRQRKLEFCDKHPSIPYVPGGQYCIITEY